MLELLLLLVLSVTTARLLSKKYHVAAIAHAVLFIVSIALFTFTTDIPFIHDAIYNWMGEMYYESLRYALDTPVNFLNIGLSGTLVAEFIILIFMPLLSIVALVEQIKDQLKKLRVKERFTFHIERIIKLVFSPIKDFKHTQNEIYLVLSRLLN